MNFAAKTEKQLHEERLIPLGIYPFDVTAAENKTSKKGNEMIQLELRVYMPDGTMREIPDWIMEKMAFKLFHFCAYTGLAVKYEQGTLQAEDCIGRSGFVKIGIQEDKTGQYPPRNSVADYMRSLDGGIKKDGAVNAKSQPSDAQLSNKSDGPDEDVPF